MRRIFGTFLKLLIAPTPSPLSSQFHTAAGDIGDPSSQLEHLAEEAVK